jgi:integrase
VLAPATVEAIRAELARLRAGRHDVRWMRQRDAVLVSVLAYAGVRPQEARGLRWGDVRDRTLLIYSPKTRRTQPSRTVRLLGPLATDLAEWRLACGRPADSEPVFCSADGEAWSANAYAQWRARAWKAALSEVGVAYRTPYALRHSFASLLAHEGRSLPYIAAQLGHSVEESARTYQHVMTELEDQPRVPAEDAIRQARAKAGLRIGFASAD